MLSEDLKVAVAIVKQAGKLLLEYFQASYDVSEKSRNNPVTTADLAVDALLRRRFREEFPSDGWLSEESGGRPERSGGRRIWIVDPLDGTKEFVKGLDEFVISVALVQDDEPELAVVYNPPRKDLFAAQRAAGASRNGLPIEVSGREQSDDSRILASRTECGDEIFKVPAHWGEIEPMGSIAYKLALVAAGAADLTISFRPKNVWDVCAGALLVQEAGGRVTDLAGQSLAFCPPFHKIQGIIAAGPGRHQSAFEWLAENSTLDPD